MYFPVTENNTHNLCPATTVSPGTPTLCPLAPTLHPYSVSIPYEATPCAYIVPNATSTRNSGPYIVSDDQTFYRNRAYMSLQTVYASNACGLVGDQHNGALLTVKSSDVYSIAGYHHEFEDVGYQVNFADFNTVPAEAYYMACDGGDAPVCDYTGTRYTFGKDFINGANTVDLRSGDVYGGPLDKASNEWIWNGAYAPTLLLPLQIRQLDTAW